LATSAANSMLELGDCQLKRNHSG